MRVIFKFFFFTIFACADAQTKQDTIKYFQQQSQVYLTKMYISKQFDTASSMWDKRMYLEMQDFYNKRKQGHFTDTILHARIKGDIEKYYKRLSKFKIGKFLGSMLEADAVYIIGQTYYSYVETINGKQTKATLMLVFISEDKGKTWVIQDWKIKDIADKVDRKIIK